MEKGCVLKEGWPKYYVGLKDGTLVVRFGSTDSDSIERTAPWRSCAAVRIWFARFAELVDAVERWLEEIGRRVS